MSSLCTPNTWQRVGQQVLDPGIDKAAVLLPDDSVFICGGHRSLLSGNSSAWRLRDGQASWIGRMTTMRAGHAACVLDDGRVLIVGGQEMGGQAHASAELYDPRAGSFTATGTMVQARVYPCATRLAGGKVLVTGGLDANGVPRSSAELYDPATGRFASVTQPMKAARGRHTSTLLRDGRVLLVSGTSAEWYDAGSGSFVATQGPTIARTNHAAALLHDGRVLIAGGYNGSTVGNQAFEEIWNDRTGQIRHVGPAGASSSPAVTVGTGPFDITRFGLTLTTLSDGRVLVVGGSPWNDPLQTDPSISGATRLFDPATETFTTLGGGGELRRAWHQALLLPTGQVVVIGGVAAKDEDFFPGTAAIWCPDPAPVALHVDFAGSGRGTVDIAPGNVHATAAVSHWFPHGTAVQLTAKALPVRITSPTEPLSLPGRPPRPTLRANRFAGWSGDATGTSPDTSVTMTAERRVYATFDETAVQPIEPRPPKIPV